MLRMDCSMKKLVLTLICVFLLPAAGYAQTTPDAAFEQRIERILLEQLQLRSTIQPLEAGSADLSVRTLIEGTPQVALIGNARIIGSRDDGSASQLSFSVLLIPDAQSIASRDLILEFANRWNGQLLPLKIVVQPGTVALMTSRLIDLNHPMQDAEIVGMYVFIMQTWQSVLTDLRTNAYFP